MVIRWCSFQSGWNHTFDDGVPARSRARSPTFWPGHGFNGSKRAFSKRFEPDRRFRILLRRSDPVVPGGKKFGWIGSAWRLGGPMISESWRSKFASSSSNTSSSSFLVTKPMRTGHGAKQRLRLEEEGKYEEKNGQTSQGLGLNWRTRPASIFL